MRRVALIPTPLKDNTGEPSHPRGKEKRRGEIDEVVGTQKWFGFTWSFLDYIVYYQVD